MAKIDPVFTLKTAIFSQHRAGDPDQGRQVAGRHSGHRRPARTDEGANTPAHGARSYRFLLSLF